MKSTHATKNRPTFPQFVQGLKDRKAFLEARGIDLTAPPTRRSKTNTFLPDVKVDAEGEVVVAAVIEN